MPNLKDKVILVTGSTDGIGKVTALQLAQMGAKVIIHGRSEQKALQTVGTLAHKVGAGELDWVGGDFSSFESVKKMASDIKSRYNRIDVLINNAGVYQKEMLLTPDGFETTFQVNHLSHFLLTYELLDLLRASEDARIIVISSVAHIRAKLDFKNLNGEKSYDAYNNYAVSKLANVMFAIDLAGKLENTNIKVNSVHPGIAHTKILGLLASASAEALGECVVAQVYLASEPRAAEYNGLYFSRTWKNPAAPGETALNEKQRKKMWDLSEKLTGISYPKIKKQKKPAAVKNE